jgi:prepilin-type N-terminal cleavage/methylation domain-containing protein
MNPNKKNKGFTLVELIVVIAVLLILAVLAVVAFQGITQAAAQAAAQADARSLAQTLNTFNSLASPDEGTGSGATNRQIRKMSHIAGRTSANTGIVNLGVSPNGGGTVADTDPVHGYLSSDLTIAFGNEGELWRAMDNIENTGEEDSGADKGPAVWTITSTLTLTNPTSVPTD